MLRPDRWSGDTKRSIAALTICAGLVITSQFTDFFKGKSKPVSETASPPAGCVEGQTELIQERLDYNQYFRGTILKAEESNEIEVSDAANEEPAIVNPLVIVCNGVIKAYVARDPNGDVQLYPAEHAKLTNTKNPEEPVSTETDSELIHGVTIALTKNDKVFVFADNHHREFGQIP